MLAKIYISVSLIVFIIGMYAIGQDATEYDKAQAARAAFALALLIVGGFAALASLF